MKIKFCSQLRPHAMLQISSYNSKSLIQSVSSQRWRRMVYKMENSVVFCHLFASLVVYDDAQPQYGRSNKRRHSNHPNNHEQLLRSRLDNCFV